MRYVWYEYQFINESVHRKSRNIKTIFSGFETKWFQLLYQGNLDINITAIQACKYFNFLKRIFQCAVFIS